MGSPARGRGAGWHVLPVGNETCLCIGASCRLRLDDRSWMSRETHVRICERVEVRSLCSTRRPRRDLSIFLRAGGWERHGNPVTVPGESVAGGVAEPAQAGLHADGRGRLDGAATRLKFGRTGLKISLHT